ncbi:MAG TPA: hypothetical protein VGI39_10465 [Polyangiaceae bacterium]
MRQSAVLRSFALALSFVLAGCSGGAGDDSSAVRFEDGSADGQPAGPDASHPSSDAGPPTADATAQDATPTPPSGDDAGEGGAADADAGGEAGTVDSGDDGGVQEAGSEGGPAEGGPPDGGGEVEAGTFPASCMNLSGEYTGATDHFFLTRPNCGSLNWAEVSGFVNPNGWTHVYTTDGAARSVSDEQGGAIVEEAHVDDVAMYVHRTNASGLDIHQKDYWSKAPCNLIGSEGVYLTRETTGSQTNCELWQLMDGCPGGTRECDADPKTVCEARTTNDPNNCGGCNIACGTANTSGPACAASRCVLSCNAGFADCNQVNSDGCEASLATDLANCGACGNVCSSIGTSAVACNQGSCALTCVTGAANCDGNAKNGCEAATDVSELNCGTCGNDCVGGACVGGQCKVKGSVLGTTDPSLGVAALAVDDANLYWFLENPITGATSGLFAVDKVKGGTVTTVTADAVLTFAVSGDGLVYYVTGPLFAPGAQTLTALNRATGQTQIVTTAQLATTGYATSFGSLLADAHGIVWTDVSTQSTGSPYTWTSQIFAWAPGDAAPRLLYTQTSASIAEPSTMNSTYALYWNDDDQTDWLLGLPRAGGPSVVLASLPDSAGAPQQALADDSFAYTWTSGGIERAPLVPGSGAPDAGSSFAAWAGALDANVGPLLQDGADIFVAPGDSSITQVIQLTKTNPPVATPVAGVSFGDSPVAVDVSAVYVVDGNLHQIRRVPR